MIFLEGIDPAPEGVPEAVWEIGRIAGRLHAWCRSIFRRSSREAEWPEGLDFSDDQTDPSATVDLLEQVESLCTPDEAACIYFKAAGYKAKEAQEILGLSESAYRQKLHRLRSRVVSLGS